MPATSVNARVVIASIWELFAGPGPGRTLVRPAKNAWAWFLGILLAVCVLAPAMARWFSAFAMVIITIIAAKLASAVTLWRSAAQTSRTPVGWALLQCFAMILVGLLVSPVLKTHVVQTFKMPTGSSSMAPTLLPGESFVVDMTATTPQRGSVVVFRTPGRQGEFVKRVVALGGDRLQMTAGVLSVNGHPASLTETSNANGGKLWIEQLPSGAPHAIAISSADPPMNDVAAVEVPPGMVFVLGDNRSESFDSRAFGPVPLENVKGTVRYVIYSPLPTGINVSRIGLRIE